MLTALLAPVLVAVGAVAVILFQGTLVVEREVEDPEPVQGVEGADEDHPVLHH